MPRLKSDQWQPSGIDELEPNAWTALQYPGSASVVAGPGAGKTEFLAQRADYLFATGLCERRRNILAISFKRDAARNLRSRVRARMPESAHRFDSLTFDAFTKSLVDRFRAALPGPWRIGRDYEISYWQRNEVGAYLNDLAAKYPDRASEIAEIPRGNFIGEIVGTHQVAAPLPDDPTATELAAFGWWDAYRQAGDPKRVDFVMLNRLAELIVRANPAIRRAIQLTYPYVFVDEFQDTTFAQYSFLRSVFGGGPTILTAVGDDKQRIMGWAGALKDAFAEFESDFDAESFELTWNHRSTADMIRLHDVVASALDPAVMPATSRVTGTVDDQPLMIWDFDNANDEARAIAQWIRDDSARSGQSPDRYALLARQKTADLQPILERELNDVGIRIRNDNGFVGNLSLQDLLANELVTCIIDFVRVASGPGGNARAWTRISEIVSQLRGSSDDDDTVSTAHRELEQFIARLRRRLAFHLPDEQSVSKLIPDIVSYLGITAIQATFPAHRQRDYLDEIIGALTARYIEVLPESRGWADLCDRAEGRDAVPLMTVHKSKGLEYHTVIFLGIDDDQWWSFCQDPLESVRTFFVGLSRAEQRTIFTYCRSRGPRRNIQALYDMLAHAGVTEFRPQPQTS